MIPKYFTLEKDGVRQFGSVGSQPSKDIEFLYSGADVQSLQSEIERLQKENDELKKYQKSFDTWAAELEW